MRLVKSFSAAIFFVICSHGCGDDSPVAGDILEDTTSIEPANKCTRAGGFCAGAWRTGGGTPGFQVDCGAGWVTTDGRQTWFGPGSELMQGLPMNGGCPNGTTDGGEASLSACCYPAVIDTPDTTVVSDTTDGEVAAEVIDDATQTDGESADVAPVVTQCVNDGGICRPAMRSSGTPGFELDCGEGYVTTQGQRSWFGPGTDLFPGTSLNGGCGQGGDAGTEAVLLGCCLPETSID